MGKVISFKPRVGKAKTGLTSGGFTVVIQKKKKKQFLSSPNDKELKSVIKGVCMCLAVSLFLKRKW